VTEPRSSYRNDEQQCPECGERIPADADVCPECDARLADDLEEVRSSSARRQRRPLYYKPHNGQMIMILGIVSFAVNILGPVAWVMGYMDLKKIRAGEMDPEGESQTRTGMICGMVSTIIHAAALVVGILIMSLMFGGVCCCGGAGILSNPGARPTTPPGQPGQPGGPGGR